MRFRASAMSLVMKCAGSYLLNKGKYDPPGVTAEEGNLAHGYASDYMQQGVPLDRIPNLEMYRAVSMYANVCLPYMVSGSTCGIERALKYENVSGWSLGGTPDFFSWGADNTLTVIDFKYGFGWVEVEENWQLMVYAILIWIKYGLPNNITPDKVRFRIIQPRANHPDGPDRPWEFDGSLLPGYLTQIADQMQLAMQSGAPTLTGNHCRYCKTIIGCDTNAEAVSHAIDLAGTASQSEITGAELAHSLATTKRACELITHRLTAMETYALEHIRRGNRVPGYHSRQTYRPLSWDIENPVQAGMEMGVDLAKVEEPITPTQAINQKLITKEQMVFMASKKMGAFKLKPENLSFAKKLIADADRR